MPTKRGIKNNTIFFNKKLQQSSIFSGSIILHFKSKNKRIIPRIGAGKVIFNMRKMYAQKNCTEKIIIKPVKKLKTFFIWDLL